MNAGGGCMYRRFLEEKLIAAEEFSPAILLLGGRQTGKTTLVRAIQGDKKYFFQIIVKFIL